MIKSYDKRNPCYQCQRRTMICHIICQAYTEWQEGHAEYKEAQRLLEHGDKTRAERIAKFKALEAKKKR